MPAPLFDAFAPGLGTAGIRHAATPSFGPLTTDHARILNANGVEIAVAASNHAALVLVLMANAGAAAIFEAGHAVKSDPDGVDQAHATGSAA